MSVTWASENSVASGNFGSGGTASGAVCVYWNCFWWSLSQFSSKFLQMGQFGPHPHFPASGATVELVVGCSWAWGSIFMRGFGIVAVAVLLVLLGGISQYFLNSKRFPNIFPASGHGVLVQTGMFLRAGGLFSEVPSCEGF